MPLSDAWIDFLAGWCSGGAAVLCCQPVDTVLTRLQAGVVVVPTSANVAVAGTTTTVSSATKQLVQRVGITSLWRGSSAMIGAVPLQNALLMGGYGVGKRWAGDQKEDGSDNTVRMHTSVFVGGLVGGILQSFVMSPVELIKVHQQVRATTTPSTSSLAIGQDVVRQVLASKQSVTQASGAPKSISIWTGLGATLLRDGIPHGVWFLSYEVCKTHLEDWNKNYHTNSNNTGGSDVDAGSRGTNWGVPLMSGAFAATVAWAVGYPFDLIKTRIQAGTSCGTIVGTGRTLVQEANGRVFQGLYRGFGLKLVRSVPASMIGFTTYELVKEVIEGL